MLRNQDEYLSCFPSFKWWRSSSGTCLFRGRSRAWRTATRMWANVPPTVSSLELSRLIVAHLVCIKCQINFGFLCRLEEIRGLLLQVWSFTFSNERVWYLETICALLHLITFLGLSLYRISVTNKGRPHEFRLFQLFQAHGFKEDPLFIDTINYFCLVSNVREDELEKFCFMLETSTDFFLLSDNFTGIMLICSASDCLIHI